MVDPEDGSVFFQQRQGNIRIFSRLIAISTEWSGSTILSLPSTTSLHTSQFTQRRTWWRRLQCRRYQFASTGAKGWKKPCMIILYFELFLSLINGAPIGRVSRMASFSSKISSLWSWCARRLDASSPLLTLFRWLLVFWVCEPWSCSQRLFCRCSCLIDPLECYFEWSSTLWHRNQFRFRKTNPYQIT